MSKERKFHRTVVEIVILSEEPWVSEDLEEIAEATDTGDCVGKVKIVKSDEVGGPAMARYLSEAGSEPAFFGLDDEGNHQNDFSDDEE